MPRITSLEPVRRDPGRLAIFLDGVFALAVPRELATEHALRAGAELDAATLEHLALRGEEQRAIDAASHFLAPRPRSEAEVRRRLARGGFPEAAIAAALDRLRALGYLDDAAFTEFWVASRRTFKPRSARLIKYELRQKGVTVEDRDLPDWDEEASARQAARRWLRTRRPDSVPNWERRLQGYLARRGFGGAVIRAILRQIQQSGSAEDPPDL